MVTVNGKVIQGSDIISGNSITIVNGKDIIKVKFGTHILFL